VNQPLCFYALKLSTLSWCTTGLVIFVKNLRKVLNSSKTALYKFDQGDCNAGVFYLKGFCNMIFTLQNFSGYEFKKLMKNKFYVPDI